MPKPYLSEYTDVCNYPFDFIITARNEVGARLCFYRCVWFCSQWGYGTPPGTRYTPRDQVHPPGPGTPPIGTRYTPRTRYTPPDQAHPPRTRYAPQDQVPPQDQVHPRDRYTPPDQAHTPQDQVHPPGTRYTPRTRYTPQVNSNFFNSNYF